MYTIHTTITHLRLRMLANALEQFIANSDPEKTGDDMTQESIEERKEAIAMLAEIDARRALPDDHPEALVPPRITK